MSKRVLILSGGGVLGAYSVGVLKALTEQGKSWDIVAGVSVGALNAGMIAQFRPSLHRIAVDELTHVWERITHNKDVYKPHAPWLLKYLWGLWKRSLYHMGPLHELIKKELNPIKLVDSGVELRVGACSITQGQFVTVSSKANINMADWIYASCIFPGMFEPVELENELWVDGGIRSTIPLASVIESQDELASIDIILTQPYSGYITPKPGDEMKSFVSVGLRVAEIMSDEVFQDDLDSCYAGNKEKVVYAPPAVLPYSGFEFNQEVIQKLIKQGYEDTKQGKNRSSIKGCTKQNKE